MKFIKKQPKIAWTKYFSEQLELGFFERKVSRTKERLLLIADMVFGLSIILFLIGLWFSMVFEIFA